MAYLTASIWPGVWALARWDESWSSYNNLYLVQDADQWILVDTGKLEHGDELLEALATIGVRPDQVTEIILTHGHKDHVGARASFPEARLWLHPLDRPMLPPETELHDLPDHGELLGFECRLLGHHTPGSVSLYHRATGTLLGADHLCFFGSGLGEEGLVGFHAHLRDWAAGFVRAWSASPVDRERYRYDLFREGLSILASYRDAKAYGSGHGGVLIGEVPALFEALLSVETGDV